MAALMQSDGYLTFWLSGFCGSNSRSVQLGRSRTYTLLEGGNPTDDGRSGVHNRLIVCVQHRLLTLDVNLATLHSPKVPL